MHGAVPGCFYASSLVWKKDFRFLVNDMTLCYICLLIPLHQQPVSHAYTNQHITLKRQTKPSLTVWRRGLGVSGGWLQICRNRYKPATHEQDMQIEIFWWLAEFCEIREMIRGEQCPEFSIISIDASYMKPL